MRSTLLVAAILISIPLIAQTREPRPSFEAASIKPYVDPGPSRDRFAGIRHIPGSLRVDMRAVTLKMLMTYAYSVRDFQVAGGPDWIDSDQYDIQAKAEDGKPPDPMPLRVQSLLADRFRLKIHLETREAPIYELAPGKGGLKLSPSADQTPPEPPGPNAPLPPPISNGGPRQRGSFLMQNGPDGWIAQATAVPLAEFTESLAELVGRPVVDRSGLKPGLYDFELRWRNTGLRALAALDAPEPDGLSIFTALQEQLGLRLISSKGPVEVVVIDDVQKPLPN